MKTETKKITRATIKSFIRKNDIYINVTSSFDGMTDCCQPVNGGFTKAQKTDEYVENTLGVRGAWFVGQSRDYFEAFEDDTYKGYKVYNSCGRFYLGIEK